MTTMTTMYGGLTLAEIDALSSDDDSSCSSSNDDYDPKSTRSSRVLGCGLSNTSPIDDPLERQMQGLLTLKSQLGMDRDLSFSPSQAEKQIEKYKLDLMTVGQRLEYKRAQAVDSMNSVTRQYVHKRKQMKERKLRRDLVYAKEEKKRHAKEQVLKAKQESKFEPLVEHCIIEEEEDSEAEA